MKKFITWSYYTSLVKSIMYEYMKEKWVSKIIVSTEKEYLWDIITFYEWDKIDNRLVLLSTTNVFDIDNLLSTYKK